MNLGCLVSWAWPFDFVLQLCLPIGYAATRLLPYFVHKCFRTGKHSDAELQSMRNVGIAASLKFLNVIHFGYILTAYIVMTCIVMAWKVPLHPSGFST